MPTAASPSDNPFFTEFLDDFFAECDEHLTSVRYNLLSLERFIQQPRVEQALLDDLLRSFHTLKGLAGMVGVQAVEQLAHQMESYLRGLRQGELGLTAAGLNALIAGTQQIEQVMAAYRTRQPAPDIAPALDQLATLLSEAAPPLPPTNGSAPPQLDEDQRRRLAGAAERGTPVWRFTFVPTPELTGRGIHVNAVRERLQAIGELIRAVPLVRGPGKIAFEFVVASNLPEADFAAWRDDGMTYTRFEPAPELPGPAAGNGTSAPASSVVAPSHVVRVDLARIDEVIHVVGELVISRARLKEQLQPLEAQIAVPSWRALQETALALERQLRDLRQGVMQMRLVPIGEVFARMRFVIHDLARESHKQVELELAGQDTEIDKFVVERMLDPLLHLVRNAVGHGLELPDERAARGKPPAGRIALRATTAGDVVIIEIEDDGRGIDPDRVAARARGLGIISGDEGLDPALLLDVICTPGFSTREQADRVSGRGVGMEVVKRTVQELGGVLALDTELGRGTHFTIQLPLTLAIVDALIVTVGGQAFAMPMASVREVIEVDPGRLTALERSEILSYRGGALPLLRLARRFRLAEPAGQPLYALVVGTGLGATGIAVDRVVGKREIVVRTIADPLIQVAGIVGATELGDGRPVLILDAQALMRVARAQSQPDSAERAGALLRRIEHSHGYGKEQPMAEAQVTSESFVLFELAGATYGLASRLVRQIEMVEQITPVPNAPVAVAGVVFSRGQVIPALDLRARFGFDRVPYTLRTRLIVAQAGERTVGLIVDTAREFVSIAGNAVQPPPEAITGLNGAYVDGIARLGERLVVLLDLDNVLAGTEPLAPDQG